MATEQQLADKLARVTSQVAASLEREAQIVNVSQEYNGTTYNTFKVMGTTNRVWVKTYGGDQNEIKEAVNVAVQPRDKLDVIIKERNVNRGDWYIVRLVGEKTDAVFGEAAPSFASPDKMASLTDQTLGVRNLIPGRVRFTETSLYVFVEPFIYIWHGDIKNWPGGAIYLGDYLPSTSAYWSWVWLGIDPITDTLVAVQGTEYATLSQLTDTTLADINMAGLYPVDPVKVQNGMTTFNRPEYIYGARAIINGAAHNDLPSLPVTISSNYSHIPAGRYTTFHKPIAITGTLTIQGTALAR